MGSVRGKTDHRISRKPAARDYGTLTKPLLPSLLNALFLGTPSKSVQGDPRNICAKFGACNQKCIKRPLLLLSHPTISKICDSQSDITEPLLRA